MQKILILGSNFGSKIYLKAVKNIFKKVDITIVSPNINKKLIIFRNLKKEKSYQQLIKANVYDLIICATDPKTQGRFLNYFFKINNNKKITTKLMLEKPLSNSFENIFRNINYLKKKNIIFNQNFIFPKIDIWPKYLNLLKNKKIDQINYTWKFKQAYFINKKETWKIKHKNGGGILLYYIIHIIFNLLKINKRILFKKIILIEKTGKYITRLKLLLKLGKSNVEIDIDINSEFRAHIIETLNKKNVYKLENLSNDWTRNFKLLLNNKVLKRTTNNRINLTQKNINELIQFKNNDKNFKNFYKLTQKNYQLLQKIEKHVY